MKLIAEMSDQEANRELRRFLNSTGEGNWARKIQKISSLPKFPAPSPNAYLTYLALRNPFVALFNEYFQLQKAGKSTWKHLTSDLKQMCGYVKVINGILQHGSPTAIAKIKSTVLDDETIRSFLFELQLAINFFRRNYDVQFIDLEESGNFDLLVSNGKDSLEIECKTKSADAGRKITRGNFYLLCDVLTARLASTKKCFALMIKCKGRLSASQQLFERFAEEIKRSLASGQMSGQLESLEYEITTLPNDLRIHNHEEAAAALTPHWSPKGHFFVFSGDTFTIVIGCESTESDRVLKAIYEELRHGAEQVSKTRPALLACFLQEIDDDSWSQLTHESGLATITHAILGSPERRHINFVTYSSDQTPPKKSGIVINFAATNLRFDNPQPQYPISLSFLKALP